MLETSRLPAVVRAAAALGFALAVSFPAVRAAADPPGERRDQVDQIRDRTRDVLRRTERMLSAARNERDVVRVACLHDKLTQLTLMLRALDDRVDQLFRSQLGADPAVAEHHFGVLSVLAERVGRLEQEANECLGQDIFDSGGTVVEMTIDPGAGRPAARSAQTPPRPPPPPPPDAPPLPSDGEREDAATDRSTMIYRASVNLGVFEVEQAQRTIASAAERLGGFVHEQTTDSLTVRVPAERFREALEQVERAGDVLAKHVQARDVGEEYRDLTIRLRNAEAMRDRLIAVLSSADEVDEMLAVERELERVTLEIERIRGRLRYLDDRIAHSTIAVAFRGTRQEGTVGSRRFRLPFPWLDDMGIGALLDLRPTTTANEHEPPPYAEPYVDELGPWPLDSLED